MRVCTLVVAGCYHSRSQHYSQLLRSLRVFQWERANLLSYSRKMIGIVLFLEILSGIVLFLEIESGIVLYLEIVSLLSTIQNVWPTA